MDESLSRVRDGFARLPVAPDVAARALAEFQRWSSEPTFADYRPQLLALVRRQAWDALLDAFWQTIPFGTGGRRGPVGIGPNRFNPWTLGTSVQAHAELLRERYPGEDVAVVVAYDTRVFKDLRRVYDPGVENPLLGLTSADLAAHAACVYAANGVRVALLDPRGGAYMSTPELSLAIRRHQAHGGLNVSASHNHPDDNGGKVYNRSGGQDVPPDDEILAQRVEHIGSVRKARWEDALADGRIRLLDPERENEHYLAVNLRLSLRPASRQGRIVYTNLHGTGVFTVARVLSRAGFDVHLVPEQLSLDGTFPGVKFLAPNPEVPSCYPPAEAVADACGADIILATDPDADRIGLEVRRPDGGWRFVTGNELLFLITRFVLAERRAAQRLPGDAFLLTTLVTSSLVGTIARSYGCAVVSDLLVGFKYMAEVLGTLEQRGAWRELVARPEGFILGCEESHGALLTPAIRDKDAGGAALALAELNAQCREEGRTVLDELHAIWRRFGYVSNTLVNTIMTGSTGLSRIRAIQESLRQDPPAAVGGRTIVRRQDMRDPGGPLGPIKSGTDASARDVLVFHLDDGSRVVLRPSGTEPKNKLYVEVPGATPRADLSTEDLAAEQVRCDGLARDLGAAFERLMLARIGLELPSHAQAVSGLVGLDHKLHFAQQFLPELERRARQGQPLLPFVDAALLPYGKDPRDLVAAGVAAWLPAAALPPSAEESVRALFRLA